MATLITFVNFFLKSATERRKGRRSQEQQEVQVDLHGGGAGRDAVPPGAAADGVAEDGAADVSV